MVRQMLGLNSAARARQIRAGSLPLKLGYGEFVLFVRHAMAGLTLPLSSFFLLLLEAYGLQLQHLTPYSITQVVIFVHLCEMFVGVKPCVSLFRYFFMLVKSGKSQDEIGGYYFQTRFGPPTPYLSGFGSGKWEDWRTDWVIATTESHERLALPTSGPSLARKEWRAKEKLPEAFKPVLEKIGMLVKDGLTSMHVLGDFLKRRIAPLQRRPLAAWTYTGPDDCGRVQRGVDADLSQDHLEVMVRGITGEPFITEHVILPEDITPLCEDQGLRMVVLTTLPMLDDMGVAVRQLGVIRTAGSGPLRSEQPPPARKRSPQAAERGAVGCNARAGPLSGSPPASARGLRGTPVRAAPSRILLGGPPVLRPLHLQYASLL